MISAQSNFSRGIGPIRRVTRRDALSELHRKTEVFAGEVMKSPLDRVSAVRVFKVRRRL